MKEAALLLSLQHAVLSDPHPAARGGRREGRKEGGDSGDTVIETGERNLRLKQEGPTHSVKPPDSLLPIDLSEEFGTTLSL